MKDGVVIGEYDVLDDETPHLNLYGTKRLCPVSTGRLCQFHAWTTATELGSVVLKPKWCKGNSIRGIAKRIIYRIVGRLFFASLCRE